MVAFVPFQLKGGTSLFFICKQETVVSTGWYLKNQPQIVDHISDINLNYSDIAREHLLKEDLSADRIIKTGSQMFEVINHYLSALQPSDVLQRLGLEKEKFFVVSSHREENINSEKNFNGLIDSLNMIADQYHYPIISSTHLRTKNMITAKNVQCARKFNF